MPTLGLHPSGSSIEGAILPSGYQRLTGATDDVRTGGQSLSSLHGSPAATTSPSGTGVAVANMAITMAMRLKRMMIGDSIVSVERCRVAVVVWYWWEGKEGGGCGL